MSWDIFSKSKIQYFLEKLKGKFVQKETGKGLSTNDYTTTDKNKVSKIDETTTSISGNPISITGLKSNQLAVNPIITLEPIQDLHGQSNPYPAGGGKNKFTYTVESIKAANTTGTWSNNVYTLNDITFTILTDSANNVIGINVNSSQGASADTNFQVAAAGSVVLTPSVEYKFNGHISPAGSASTWRMGLGIFGYVYGESDEKTASVNAGYSGNCFITVFSGAKPNNVKFYPMIRLATETDATFAPPSNISPISGYDKIEALSCGKNLFDKTRVELGQINQTTGEDENSSTVYRYKGYIYLKPNTKYTIGKNNGQTLRVFFYSQNDYLNSSTYTGTVTTFNTGNTIRRIRFQSADFNTIKEILQVEEGTSASTIYPYNKATSISESLGQTVYGLTHEVRTGKARVTLKDLDLGDLTWTYYSGDRIFVASMPNDVISPIAGGGDGVCDIYARYSGAGSEQPDNAFTYCDSTRNPNKIIIVTNSAYTNGNTFKTAMTGHKLIYQLATPTEIQLTPHEISLLKDYAYVSTNGTNIALDYHNGELASLSDVAQVGETLNSIDKSVTSGTLTDLVKQGNYGIFYYELKKSGRLVELYLELYNVRYTTLTRIANLPTGFIPAHRKTANIIVADSGTGLIQKGFMRVDVTNTGEIQAAFMGSTSENIYAHVTLMYYV